MFAERLYPFWKHPSVTKKFKNSKNENFIPPNAKQAGVGDASAPDTRCRAADDRFVFPKGVRVRGGAGGWRRWGVRGGVYALCASARRLAILWGAPAGVLRADPDRARWGRGQVDGGSKCGSPEASCAPTPVQSGGRRRAARLAAVPLQPPRTNSGMPNPRAARGKAGDPPGPETPSRLGGAASPAPATDSRPRRDVVKRKRLIEDDDFDQPCVKRDLLAHALRGLKAAANAMASHLPTLSVGRLFDAKRVVGGATAFAVGDHVMALYSDGEYYSAVVAERWREAGVHAKYRLAWDDGDTRATVKTADEMMLLEDFKKCAEKAIKRQKCSAGGAEGEHQHKDDTGKAGKAEKAAAPEREGAKERAGTAGQRSAAVYSFNAAIRGAVPAFQRRDWGLRMVRAVGRNRPPFARTMLYHGTLPFAVDSDGQGMAKQTGPGGFWVVKRWPGSNARKLIDTQVHEYVRSHPHPNLVRILDVSTTEGVLMDYFEDGDLHSRMATARRTFVPVAHVVQYLMQLMQALRHLHALDVVHCDVAPANIFLRRHRDDGDGAPADCRHASYSLALGDFGHSYILNKHEESRSSVAQQGLGAEFVAPEVKAGGASTKESDVFSAGKILESFLNLSSAFKAEMVHEPRSVVRKLRGLAADMCGVSSKRPSSSMVCARLESLLP